jgi:Ctr copper transporter family
MSSSSTSSSSTSTSMSTMTMEMVFTNSHTTPLFSSSWTPSTSGQYAGTCIFLIVLGIIGRCLMAFKASMERRWLAIALDRRYVIVAGQKPESGLGNMDSDSNNGIVKTGVLTCQGVDETVRVVRQVATETQPWRFSVDLPRACLAFVVTGVSYLLYATLFTHTTASSPIFVSGLIEYPQHVGGDDAERGLFHVCVGRRVYRRAGCGPSHCPLERALEGFESLYIP